MRRLSRKADLSLSTNAIVVMIIAIVILGLALTFTRGIFQRLGGSLGNIGEQNIEEPPTYNKPLTLTSSTLEIRKGTSKSIGIAVYNKFNNNPACINGDEDACKNEISVELGDCMGNINGVSTNVGPTRTDESTPLITLNPPPSANEILINEYYVFNTKIRIAAGLAPGDYACRVHATGIVLVGEQPTEKTLTSIDMIITVN